MSSEIRVKLCGLSRVEDIDAVNQIRPDYIGFVFAPSSRRYVEPGRAALLKWKLVEGIKVVGVFVNESLEIVADIVDKGIIDIPQLHGQEDDEYILELKSMIKAPVIKAFRIDNEDDVRRANASAADMVLLDSGAGGTGTVFDWSLLAAIERPYVLAGGLGPDNVEAGLRSLAEQNIKKPWGLDVSSGIETDGVKDRNKMEKFTGIVKGEIK